MAKIPVVVALWAFSILGSILPAFSQTPTARAGLAILSVSTNVLHGGTFLLFGEIQNDLGFAVDQIRLNVTMYDSSGNVIANSTAHPFMESLRPGERSAFEISFANSGDVSSFAFYGIGESWHQADPKPGLLQLHVSDMQVDNCGLLHLTGKVLNYAGMNTSGTIVSATFYNAKGQVIGTGWTKSGDAYNQIQSAGSADFDIVLSTDMIRSQPAYASVNVQSDQYSSNPVVFENMDRRSPAVEAAVFTGNASYPLRPTMINFTGFVTSYNESLSPFVVIQLFSPSEELLGRFTAKPQVDGQYSRQFEFLAAPSLAGQMITVRAEYLGKIAENTFMVGSEWPTQDICGNYAASIQDQPSVAGQNAGSVSSPWAADAPVSSSSVKESIWVHNYYSEIIPYTAIIQVTDEMGATVIVKSLQGTLAPNSWTQLSATWPANERGLYHVKCFIINSLSEPELLAPPHEHPRDVI